MTGDEDLARPASWLAAERHLTRPLARLAALQARLDERLAAFAAADPVHAPKMARKGLRDGAPDGSGFGDGGADGLGGAGPALTRLAGEEAVALARATGARLPLESFLLWRHGAPIRRADPADLARAGWAARRLAAPPQSLAAALRDPAGLQRFLGLAGHSVGSGLAAGSAAGEGPGGADPALAMLLAREAGAEWHRAAEGFLADLAGLAALGPPARAAAALALWQGAGLGPMLEGAVLAARIGAWPDHAVQKVGTERTAADIAVGVGMARDIGAAAATILGIGPEAGDIAAPAGGMPASSGPVGGPVWARFLPLGALPTPARPGRARAADRLAALVAAATAQLPICLAGLTRRRDWAAAATRALPGGKVARAALPLFCHEALVSANLLRDRLGVSQQAANAALLRLAELGLIEELSGQRRYRLWRARL
ncbi:MAG: hypothetical protein AAGD12_07030 [Pseudomonadota bacterium]